MVAVFSINSHYYRKQTIQVSTRNPEIGMSSIGLRTPW